MTPPDQSSSLVAMISDLREITEAVNGGATWAQVGAALDPPVTGRQAKRHAHKLREQIKTELQALSGKLAAAQARNGGSDRARIPP